MSEQFDSIMKGLNDLLEYAKGDKTKARVRVVEVENVNIKPLTHYSKEQIKSFRLNNLNH